LLRNAQHKPYVSRTPPPPPPPAAAPPRLAHAPDSPADPIRTHTPSPPARPALDPRARAFHAHASDPDSPDHPRWDASEPHEFAVFNAFACKTTFSRADVPPGHEIFGYTWQCTWKSNRGNGKPPAPSRFCIAGHCEWAKDTDGPTSPVTPNRAIRAAISVAHILHWAVHTEDFLRAYLQSDLLTTPIYVHAPPDSGEPADAVWAFTRPMYGKADAGLHFFFSTQAKFFAPSLVSP